MTIANNLSDPKRELRKTKKGLQQLTDAVLVALAQIDTLMKQPPGLDRDQKLARISNWLEQHNDAARYSVLGVNFRTDDKGKAVAAARTRLNKA